MPSDIPIEGVSSLVAEAWLLKEEHESWGWSRLQRTIFAMQKRWTCCSRFKEALKNSSRFMMQKEYSGDRSVDWLRIERPGQR